MRKTKSARVAMQSPREQREIRAMCLSEAVRICSGNSASSMQSHIRKQILDTAKAFETFVNTGKVGN